ncbi:AraC family transcriptional regulator [Acidaminobacter sp. JC074]|uniref:AraC family transcriptional regulator n=1 Tax=Acidaminobacter sp. JC074 TaxID=2530199 RepID=UPI001F0DCEDF|nr:AraC family transcriptional regulator [Acidaminobacter sp. JC074]MCH4887015.1 AraC family transcriptional regulator [Acidaminobacter sp. JC074]
MNTIYSSDKYKFHKESSKKCDVSIHLHDVYEIYQAESDNIRYFIEGNYYDLNKGDIIITNMKELHRPITIDDKDYKRRFIQFKPEAFESFFEDLNPLTIFDRRPLGLYNCFKYTDKLNRLFDTIEACSDNPIGKLEMKNLLVQIFVELYKVYEEKEKPKDLDSRILKVKEDLDQHFTHDFNLEDFSKKHFMDKYYLSHLFKEQTGFTLLEYIQSKRIQLAKTMIKNDHLMTEVAETCGFKDYSNFYRVFKKITKSSPRDYSNSH